MSENPPTVDPRPTRPNEEGKARMVDISAKAESSRLALAEAVLEMHPDTYQRILNGELPKGDALAVARVAGITGAKQTPALMPLCHPIPLAEVQLDFEPGATAGTLRVLCQCRVRAATGVEMEALTGAVTAALCIYDMAKALDKSMTIARVRLLEKSGGRSGTWRHPAWRDQGTQGEGSDRRGQPE